MPFPFQGAAGCGGAYSGEAVDQEGLRPLLSGRNTLWILHQAGMRDVHGPFEVTGFELIAPSYIKDGDRSP